MRLLTLEGLPKTCSDLARILGGRGKTIMTIPATASTTTTSSTRSKTDEIVASFAGLLAKAKMLQRVATQAETCCCAHWIELPLVMTEEERGALFNVYMDISDALIELLNIPIDSHTVLVLDTDVHDCFETLLESMEARDLTYHDLSSLLCFFKHSIQDRCAVRIIQCPPRAGENMFELLRLGHTIIRYYGFPVHRHQSHSF